MRGLIRSTKTREYDLFLSVLLESRKESGVSQRELARRIGRTQTYVSKIERGDQRMDIVELLAYCAGIGKQASHLVLRLELAVKSENGVSCP